MEKIPFGLSKRAYGLVIAVAVSLGGFLFGFNISVISGAILFVRNQFHLTPVETEVAVSIVLAGAAPGAAFAGYIGDHFGRRPVLILNAVLFGAFAVITGLANGLPSFLAARFGVGVAVGVAAVLTPLYIAEISPPKIRGRMVTLNQLAIVTGILIAYYVNYLFSSSSNWRGMFVSAVIPSAILLVALVFLPESPRWLVAHQRTETAFEVLNQIENTDDAGRHLQELLEITQMDHLRFPDLFGERFKMPLLIGVGLAIFQQITGNTTIVFYTPTILQMAGFKSASSAILATVLLGGVNLVMTIVALFLLDKVGRRPLLLLGIAGMTISLIHLGYLFGASHVSRFAILADVIVFLGSFAFSLGPIFWLLISEIYPTTIRGQAMSVASVTVKLTALLVSVTFLSLVGTLGARFSFWIYAIACIAAFVFSFYLVPETKGRTLEEIESSWGSRSVSHSVLHE